LSVRGLLIPEAELSWRFSRASGPGGQSVNTSDSRVELTFDVARSPSLPEHLRDRAVARLGGRLVDGRLTITASEYRSQHRNRDAARARLVDVLTDARRPPAAKRRPTRPTRGSKERRLAGKKRRGEVKALRRRPVD
jgi:ribosome-associated protein